MPSGENVSTDALLDDVRRVADELGRPPTYREYQPHGEYSYGLLWHRFGGWQDVLEAAGFDPREADYYHDSSKLAAMDPEDLVPGEKSRTRSHARPKPDPTGPISKRRRGDTPLTDPIPNARRPPRTWLPPPAGGLPFSRRMAPSASAIDHIQA